MMYAGSGWQPIGTAPENKEVKTCIINSRGEERNHQKMIRQGRLWFIGGMYIYYNPTHWKPID